MNTNDILKKVDHTLLALSATWEDFKVILDDGIKYGTASACIPAAYVKQAVEYVDGKLPICTVIGFPNGYSTTAVKVFETKDAIENGASEIDMVINIGKAKEHDYTYIEDEIKMVVAASTGKTTKVIIETCYLNDEEKMNCCLAAKKAKATFVKTSTGFGTGGATANDIRLMRETVGPDMGVKASGGIRNLDDLELMVENGATRIGASSGVAIMENSSSKNEY